MATITEESFTHKEPYMERVRAQMEKWCEGLQKLDAEIETFSPQVSANYQQEIGLLHAKWRELETMSDEMSDAGSEQWDAARYQWGRSATDYLLSYMAAAERVQNEHHVPGGGAHGATTQRVRQPGN